jgi:putative membrane protein
MRQRGLRQYLTLALKGMAMGAADVVPGVSGGTIAFISGIYEELLSAISAFDRAAFASLFAGRFKEFWKHINGSFLVVLLSGILISVVSLAQLLSWMLEHKPVLLWSFFFGLVLASIIFVGKEIRSRALWVWLLLILGAVLAYYITTLEPLVTGGSSLFYLFLSGMLAICAMILPGISGAFILVLLGAYGMVLRAIHEHDLLLLAVLAAGGVTGLLTFSKLLKWLFDRYRNGMLALLTGFIAGSLNKIWPWKQVMETRMFEGKELVIKEISVLPGQFKGDPELGAAIVLGVLGFCLILLLERMANLSKWNNG